MLGVTSGNIRQQQVHIASSIEERLIFCFLTMTGEALKVQTEARQKLSGHSKSGASLRFVLLPCGLIFAVLLLEGPALLKIVDYRKVIGIASHDVFSATNLDDPELGHIHPPYSHFAGEVRGGGLTVGYNIPAENTTVYRWDVRYDHNGFRNVVDLKSADMVVLGDSFVEEITIPDAELMTSVLARLQGETVANLGQYGYGPQQELAVLKRFGLPLHPRLVIWMFFEGNDLEDVLNYNRAMLQRRSSWSDFRARSFTRNALKRIERFVLAPAKSPGIEHSGFIEEPNGKKLTMYFLPFPVEPLRNDELSAIDETGRILAVAHRLCAEHQARLILVFIPDKFRVFHEFCQFPEEAECRKWVVSDLPDRIRKAVKSISPEMVFLDLTPHLVDAVKKGEIPYYPDDDHWSPEGHRTAAQAINNYLFPAGTSGKQLVGLDSK